MVYLISYDLNDRDKNYEGVSQAIIDVSGGYYVHRLDSTWIIKSSALSATDIFAKIKPALDSNDTCLVIEVKNNKQGHFTKKEWEEINALFS